MISIEIDNLKQVQQALKDQPKKVNLVLSRAINRAATNAKSNMSKKVRENYLISAADVKATINLTKATSSKPFARVKSTGKRINFAKFKVTPRNFVKGKSGYSVQIKKEGGSKVIPGFMAGTNPNQEFRWGFYRRTGKERWPVKQLMGPAVPQMIGSKNVISWVESEAQAMLNQRIQHELEQVLGAKSS